MGGSASSSSSTVIGGSVFSLQRGLRNVFPRGALRAFAPLALFVLTPGSRSLKTGA